MARTHSSWFVGGIKKFPQSRLSRDLCSFLNTVREPGPDPRWRLRAPVTPLPGFSRLAAAAATPRVPLQPGPATVPWSLAG